MTLDRMSWTLSPHRLHAGARRPSRHAHRAVAHLWARPRGPCSQCPGDRRVDDRGHPPSVALAFGAPAPERRRSRPKSPAPRLSWGCSASPRIRCVRLCPLPRPGGRFGQEVPSPRISFRPRDSFTSAAFSTVGRQVCCTLTPDEVRPVSAAVPLRRSMGCPKASAPHTDVPTPPLSRGAVPLEDHSPSTAPLASPRAASLLWFLRPPFRRRLCDRSITTPSRQAAATPGPCSIVGSGQPTPRSTAMQTPHLPWAFLAGGPGGAWGTRSWTLRRGDARPGPTVIGA